MQDKALQSEKMQDNPAKSRTVGNSAAVISLADHVQAEDSDVLF